MNVNENTNGFWNGKKAKLEVLKDGKRLIFTAKIIECDSNSITFLDRHNAVYSFRRNDVVEMQELKGGA